MPSSSSSEAPPPVETQEISLGEPELLHCAHRVAPADDRIPLDVGHRLCHGFRPLRRTSPTRTRPSARSRTPCARRGSPSRTARASRARCRGRASPPASASNGVTFVSASSSNAEAATTSVGSTASYGSGFSSRSSSAIFPPTSTASARCPRLDEHAELVLDLRPAGDEDERPLDVGEEAAEHLELLLEQQPCVGRQQLRDARPSTRARGAPSRTRPARTDPVLLRASSPSRDRSSSRRDRSGCSRGHRRRSSGSSSRRRAATGRSRTRDRAPWDGRDASRRRPRPRRCRAGGAASSSEAWIRVSSAIAAVLERDVEVGSDENALARDVRSTDGAGRVLHGSSFPIRSTRRQL